MVKKKVPVLVLAFNRPNHVKKTMDAIRCYKPDDLYLACDGPRKVINEAALVEETRNVMLSAIDWNCKLKTLFQNSNLGCAKSIYNAITWFFENEEYGIIIEDDVIVGEDFFKLCEELLPRYKDVDRVMEISARNHSRRTDIPNSYVYSQYMYNWGWATWRRAWAKMDMSMDTIKKISMTYLVKRLGVFRGVMMRRYFISAYKNRENITTWDTQWYMSLLANDGLTICPGVNLAANIGMGEGTHYHPTDKDPYRDISVGSLEWPLVYNDSMCPDIKQKRYENKDFLQLRMTGIRNKLCLIFQLHC